VKNPRNAGRDRWAKRRESKKEGVALLGIASIECDEEVSPRFFLYHCPAGPVRTTLLSHAWMSP